MRRTNTKEYEENGRTRGACEIGGKEARGTRYAFQISIVSGLGTMGGAQICVIVVASQGLSGRNNYHVPEFRCTRDIADSPTGFLSTILYADLRRLSAYAFGKLLLEKLGKKEIVRAGELSIVESSR